MKKISSTKDITENPPQLTDSNSNFILILNVNRNVSTGTTLCPEKSTPPDIVE